MKQKTHNRMPHSKAPTVIEARVMMRVRKEKSPGEGGGVIGGSGGIITTVGRPAQLAMSFAGGGTYGGRCGGLDGGGRLGGKEGGDGGACGGLGGGGVMGG